MFQRYREAVSYVEGFSNASMEKGDGANPSIFLKRMQHLLDLLGNPERDFKYVHVTGTGGKGTVAAMIHESLAASGRISGLFTSPYATAAIEEIRVADLYISPEDFADIVEYMKPFVERASRSEYGAPSGTGLFFAMALLYFKKQKCEWAVIEVGVGGRYDFTNVIPDPVATVITHIDFDHTEVLGKTIKEITLDKAGIIKKNSRFFTAESRATIKKLFREICAEQGATFCEVIPRISEGDNESLARTVGESIGLKENDIQKGIKNTFLPCRFEVVSEKPTIILDGAHNRSKMRNTVSRLGGIPHKKLILIVAIGNLKKDNLNIFKEIVPVADSVILTTFHSSKRQSVHPNALEPLVKKLMRKGTALEIADGPEKALHIATKQASLNDLILVTGSFFLAGELRKKWFSEEWVLEHRKSFK